MKTIIIDDDASAVDLLVENLKQYEDIEIAGIASIGKQGIELIKSEKPDIIFLDIELPDMSGLEFLDHVSETTDNKFKTIIYTGHSSYMLPAFRNQAFDFLMKPVDPNELETVLQRLYMYRSEQNDNDNTLIKNKDNDKILFYTNSVDFRLVNIRDIGLFQYNHELRVWEVILASKKEPIRMKRNTNNEILLAIDPRFIQVSQRYIININYLLEVTDNICHLYPPFDKIDYIKIGRLFRRKLIERFSTL